MRKLLVLAALAAAGCTPSFKAALGQGEVEAGEWEYIRTTPAQMGDPAKTSEPKRYCILPEEAEKLTLETLLNDHTLSRCLTDRARIADGKIHADGKCDTPDGDIRGIPMTIDGTYTRNSFVIDSSMEIFGGRLTDHGAGTRVGDCNLGNRPSLE